MKPAIKSIFYIIIFIVLMLAGCEEEATDDYYNFKVMSSNGPFAGYYSSDDEGYKYFYGTPVVGTNYYSCEVDLDSPGSVTVSATGDVSATSISIYIYKDSALEDSVTVTQTTVSGATPEAVTASLTYDYNETDSESDSSSD